MAREGKIKGTLLGIVVAALFGYGCSEERAMDANTDRQPPEDLPLLNPQGETIVQDDPFRIACLSELEAKSELLGLKMGAPLLTTSERWGTILRADFSFTDPAEGQGVNRVVCWKGADGRLRIVYGTEQNLAPLEVKTPRQ
jgi:hypothetical protein